jgi:hypothetical protein
VILPEASLPGLARKSIDLRNKIAARVKPAPDGWNVDARPPA